MIGIVRSKKQLITAIKSSGSTPTTFTPIKFTRPVAYAAYGTSPFAYTGYAFSNVTAWLQPSQAQVLNVALPLLCRRTRSCSTCVTRWIFLIRCSRTQHCTSSWDICQPICKSCNWFKEAQVQSWRSRGQWNNGCQGALTSHPSTQGIFSWQFLGYAITVKQIKDENCKNLLVLLEAALYCTMYYLVNYAKALDPSANGWKC